MGNTTVLWVVGGVGVLLLYAAYKRRSPFAIVGATIGGATGPAASSIVGGA
jgi:hypothetical protein